MTAAATFDAKAKIESERACAAAELTGYVRSMIQFNDIPACHVDQVKSLVERLSSAYGIAAPANIGAIR